MENRPVSVSEVVPVHVFQESVLTRVATVPGVMNRTRILDSELVGQGGTAAPFIWFAKSEAQGRF